MKTPIHDLTKKQALIYDAKSGNTLMIQYFDFSDQFLFGMNGAYVFADRDQLATALHELTNPDQKEQKHGKK